MIGIGKENILNADARREVINQLFLLARKYMLNDEEKQKIIVIINSFKQKSDKQIERFILYYNLNNDGDYSFTELAEKYNCSINSVRTSVNRICSKIFFLKDERFSIIKDIVFQCKKRNNTK